MSDVIIEGPESKAENRDIWNKILADTWISTGRLISASVLCFCENGAIGCCHFSGVQDVESAGE